MASKFIFNENTKPFYTSRTQKIICETLKRDGEIELGPKTSEVHKSALTLIKLNPNVFEIVEEKEFYKRPLQDDYHPEPVLRYYLFLARVESNN
jgi:hypothetical protein